jgi:TetR/AcrR family transcriptional repressor of mexJK operon
MPGIDEAVKLAAPRRGGRPVQAQSQRIRDHILDTATAMFLSQGYGATSIEALAKAAGISKRTFYHRFEHKAALFGAVVQRLIMRLQPTDNARLFQGDTPDEVLTRLARIILRAVLTPEALALHRMVVGDASRFPELAGILGNQGARQDAVNRIAGLMQQYIEQKIIRLADSEFAAEQFLHMVIAVPQRRALGIGAAMDAVELEAWASRSVALFLDGCRG